MLVPVAQRKVITKSEAANHFFARPTSGIGGATTPSSLTTISMSCGLISLESSTFQRNSPVRESIPGLGHAVELRVYRSRGQLRVDWWYDARRIDGSAAQALADRFGSELTGLVAEAAIEEELDSANEELTLVEFD